MDTSAFTHFHRAGYGDVLGLVAPRAIVLVPREVETEIERARERYTGVPTLDQVTWVQRTFLSDDEGWRAMQVKAALGGGTREHLGECAVIACARQRGLVAVLDDATAVRQAKQYGVEWTNTMRIAAKVHTEVHKGDKTKTIALVDALLDTDMRLPVTSGAQLFE